MNNASRTTTRVVAVLMAIILIASMLPVTVFADGQANDTGYVYISVSDDQSFAFDTNGDPIAFTAVSLDDLATVDLSDYGLDGYAYDNDSDGTPEITALHLYIHVHEQLLGLDWSEVYISGGAGSIYFAGGLFGFSDENLRYDLNGAYPSVDGWGLTADRIVLSDGDFINVAHYSSWAFWGDSITGFHYFTSADGDLAHLYNACAGESIELGLVRSFSDWMNGGIAAFASEASYEVYYGKTYGTAEGTLYTDDNGMFCVTFPSEGTWYVWADGGYGSENPQDIVSAPAFATVIVTDNADARFADEVEAKIDAIGEVTVHSVNKIKAARTAYDALTVAQKQYVDNYRILTDAESKIADLLIEAAEADHKAIYEATGKYISGLGTPSVGSVGGEWMVIDLVRAGYPCPEGYYENVVEYVKEKINANEQLHRSKSTDNSRVILALTAAGYDVTDVDGHNLLMGLTDMSYVTKQGINGPIWALIAFDCYKYDIPVNSDATEQVTRETLISYILEKQLEDGGWAMSGSKADSDMTGMAVQSLAPYYNTNDEVKVAVDKALACLSDLQYDNGGFGSVDGDCSESCAQVIVALAALGIDPETDSRFVKNGVSVLDAMCQFAVEGGGFEHIPSGGLNGMATEQGQYALTAYFRFLNGETSLYDMTDVDISKIKVGDINGDSAIDSEDYVAAKRYCFGTMNLSDEQLAAANVDGSTDENGNPTVDACDYILLKRYCFGTYVFD